MHLPTFSAACPEIVYHYCSVETFYHIVNNRTLRLSDIEKSNDFMEKKWAIRQCIQHIKHNLDNPLYACALHPKFASELLEEMQIQFQKYNTVILASCFSSESDLLSQWRGYGDNGYGVSIGFNAGSEFRPAFERAQSYLGLKGTEYLPSGFLFHSIQYTTEQIETICMKLFCAYTRWHPNHIEVKKAANELVRLLYPALPFFKSAAFSEEREWRCVYYPHLPAPPYETENLDESSFQKLIAAQLKQQEIDQFSLLPLDYRLRKANLVAYRDMKFPTSGRPFIKSVTIGPKCALDRETVKVFLERNGLPIALDDISLSEVSYR